MEELRDERGLLLLHPFDDPGVIAGQGTVGLEILEDLPEVDVVVVGVGGGGLISGIGAAVKQLRPAARVIGVEPETEQRAVTSAWRPVSRFDSTRFPSRTASGPRLPAPGRSTSRGATWTRSCWSTRRRSPRGVRFALERMKQLLEPAGAAALGAVLAGRIDLRDGETVCVVASGGNVDLDRLPSILELAYS